MLSWLLPYLAKGHKPDFNNGKGGYSNNGRIVAPHPSVCSSSTRIMAPPQAIPIFCQIELHLLMSPTSVHVSYLCSCLLLLPGRCHIWPRAAGLTSVMALKVTRIVAPFCPPPRRLFESDSNNGPSPGHYNSELQT